MMEDQRKQVAKLARKFYAKEITFDEFLMKVPEDDTDSDISELLDLIEHEPKLGGFMGVNHERHNNYMKEINNLIDKLEADS